MTRSKEAIRKIIAENIKNKRNSLNMTVEELAETLSLAPGTVKFIEQSRRGVTYYNLYKLSQIFNVSIDELYATSNKANRVSENMDDSLRAVETKRAKISSLLFGLSEPELDYVISTINNIRTMVGTMKNENLLEDESVDVDDEDSLS